MRPYALATLFALASQPAVAETILTCYYEEGQSYYPALKDAQSKQIGWKEEGSKGAVIRLDKTQDGYDLLYGDGKAALESSTTQGATVADLSHEEESATFLVLYPNRAIETYYFYENTKETPELLLSQVRFNDAVGVSAVSRYLCKRKRDEELEKRSQQSQEAQSPT